MNPLHPEIEPFDSGMLDVGGGDNVYWETCGNPRGKTALVLHGGPGSGCSPWFRRLLDPTTYRIVLFDQRNCGRSLPPASHPGTGLANNTTANLVSDIELLREHLGIDRWLILGGSWGSTLALAYSVRHTDRVSGLILFGVTTGRHAEFDRTFRGGLARFFPEQWERLRASALGPGPGSDVVDAYHRLVNDPDPAVHRSAAAASCLWESATPTWPPTPRLAARFENPDYALVFARIVTHYVRNNAWLDDGVLLQAAHCLAGTPGILINGRLDFQAPIANAWKLKRAWPRAELIIVDDTGHHPTDALTEELIKATDRFVTPQ